MAIHFLENKQQFILNTKKTTYAFQVLRNRYLCHLALSRTGVKFCALSPGI